jgi:hypothetical protein
MQDDVTIVQRGVSFLSPARLQEGERWMLKQLASVPAARRLYERRAGATQREGESEMREQREQQRQASRVEALGGAPPSAAYRALP